MSRQTRSKSSSDFAGEKIDGGEAGDFARMRIQSPSRILSGFLIHVATRRKREYLLYLWTGIIHRAPRLFVSVKLAYYFAGTHGSAKSNIAV